MSSRDSLDRLLSAAPPLGAWVEQAACADPAVEVADVYTSDAPDVRDLAVATVVCAHCPVRRECADYATRTPVHGLWGAQWRGRRVKPRAA